MYAEFSAAVQSLNALRQIVSAAHGLTNYNELVSAVSEVSAKLMAAQAVALGSQEKQATLANEITELKNRIVEFENWQAEAARYVLNDLGSGKFVYALKSGMENGEPRHYLCASCMNKRKKSILQEQHNTNGSWYRCHEPTCKSEVSISRSSGSFEP